MKIALYGATGMIGSRIAAEATARGHQVTGLSRSGGDLPDGVVAATGDLADAAAVREVAVAHDVVVNATGPSRTGADHAEWLSAVATLIAHAEGTRVAQVGGAGSLEVDGVRLLDQPDFPEAYQAEARTGAEALALFRQAPESVDWTYLSPAPVIAPGERTGRYTLATDSPAGTSISAEDFAVALLDELEQPSYRHARFTAATA